MRSLGAGSRVPARRTRVAAAAGIAVFAAALALVQLHLEPSGHSDFDQAWFGSRALWRGADPYALVGPGRAFEWPWPLFYPATALVGISPLALLPMIPARILFVSLSAGTLAWAVTAESLVPLVAFASAAFVVAARAAQWSPLLVAASLVPGLAWILCAKPNIGMALVLGARSWRVAAMAAAGAAVLAAIALALRPTWPVEWWSIARAGAQARSPLFAAGGICVLLALTRWRRPEARLLVALALVPQTFSVYETLPLIFIGRSFREIAVLSALSDATFFGQVALGTNGDAHSYASAGALTVALMYLPALLIILRRDNAYPVHAPVPALAT